MENDQRPPQALLFARVSEIPLVKEFCRKVVLTYETTKGSNALIGATLGKVEDYAKLANEQVEPLKKLLDTPISIVSKIADKQLEELQRRYPVINSTPTDVLEYGQGLYEKSGVKNRVDDIAVAKDRSVEKITDTTVDYRNRLLRSALIGRNTADHLISGTLNYTEGIVDKYVAPPNRSPYSEGDNAGRSGESYSNRIRQLTSKVKDGVTYRSVASYGVAKKIGQQTYEVTDKLIKDVKDSASSTIQKTTTDLNSIRQSALTELVRRSGEITAKTDSTAVSLTRSISHVVSLLSDRLLAFSVPYLPEGLEKPASSLVSYAHYWEEEIAKASSISDIWRTATNETKRNAQFVREMIQSLLNHNTNELKVESKRW